MSVVDVAYCPHCGNTTPQELVGQTLSLHNRDGSHQYFMTRCGTCLEALLYRHVDPENGMPETADGAFDLGRYRLVWPDFDVLPPGVPETVRRCYEEAAMIKRRAPNAFAIQIRRALEAVCKHRGTGNLVLALNLQELARRGEIPATLAEMNDVLRRIGNAGLHGDEDIDPEYVELIHDYFMAVIEYVYVAPRMANEFHARLDHLRRSRLARDGVASPV